MLDAVVMVSGFKIRISGAVLHVTAFIFGNAKIALDGTAVGSGVVQTLVRGVLLNKVCLTQ